MAESTTPLVTVIIVNVNMPLIILRKEQNVVKRCHLNSLVGTFYSINLD